MAINEVKDVLHGMPREKASRPDNMTMEVLVHHWETTPIEPMMNDLLAPTICWSQLDTVSEINLMNDLMNDHWETTPIDDVSSICWRQADNPLFLQSSEDANSNESHISCADPKTWIADDFQ